MSATKWVAKPLVFAACLLPGVYLAAGAFGVLGVSLGADPVKHMLHACGLWALRFLFITLCMTPLRDVGKVESYQVLDALRKQMLHPYQAIHAGSCAILVQSAPTPGCRL